jgi:putative ABC transport system permease protein
LGLTAGILLILAFGLPPLLRLAQVPALRVLRRDLGPPPDSARGAQILALALVAALTLLQAGEWKMALLAGAGVAGALLAAAGLAWSALPGLALLARRLPPGPRLALGGLARRKTETALQAAALGLGLLVLLLLTQVRGDLLASWRGNILPGAPNRFVINIQPDQVTPVRDWLQRHGVSDTTLYPMIRARLMAISGKPVRIEDYPEGRARRLAEREFNLSELSTLPPDNTLHAGHWWAPGQASGFTVEKDLAKTLGIQLGDRLDFDVGGLPLSAQVLSLREVKWDSFRPNFFVATPPGALDPLPRSYITALHVPREQGVLLAQLVNDFPNLTVFDVAQLMDEMQAMTDRLGLAVQVVFAFSLAAGVLVLLAALHARRQEQAREISLWRILGAGDRTLRLALVSELTALGALSGAVAAASASATAWVLARQVFDLPHHPNPMIWLYGMGGGIALALLAGWPTLASLLRNPPLRTLRAAG